MSTAVTVAAAPVCTILGVQFVSLPPPEIDTAFASEATEPNPPHFGFFRSVATDVYGISEIWVQRPSGQVLVSARARPATRPAFGDLKGSAWSIRAQDVTAATPSSPVFAAGSANRGNEQDDAMAGAATLPQLMKVGTANQQIFACAGGRSEDNQVRTTVLIEVKPPDFTASPPTSGSASFIQDLLNGDDRFVPNAPGPLIGPANPPTPTITNRPGNPVREGSVQCAMTQLDDDVTTRELHMLTISNGVLYHSVANNFSPATSGSGSFTFNRFNSVSPWGDVGQALGGGFGTVVASAIVASRPTAVSVFFVAESGGRYRLFHTVRFADGSWRPADDVLAMNGGTLNGTNFPFKVAAGMCPVFGQPQDSELVYVMWDEDQVTHVGRVASASPLYPPMSRIFPGGVSDPARQPTLQLGVTVRPVRQSPP